jgi:hypothetical protein
MLSPNVRKSKCSQPSSKRRIFVGSGLDKSETFGVRDWIFRDIATQRFKTRKTGTSKQNGHKWDPSSWNCSPLNTCSICTCVSTPWETTFVQPLPSVTSDYAFHLCVTLPETYQWQRGLCGTRLLGFSNCRVTMAFYVPIRLFSWIISSLTLKIFSSYILSIIYFYARAVGLHYTAATLTLRICVCM